LLSLHLFRSSLVQSQIFFPRCGRSRKSYYSHSTVLIRDKISQVQSPGLPFISPDSGKLGILRSTFYFRRLSSVDFVGVGVQWTFFEPLAANGGDRGVVSSASLKHRGQDELTCRETFILAKVVLLHVTFTVGIHRGYATTNSMFTY